MILQVFLSTFGIVFLAELGDKTQLTAMALSTRHRWTEIFPGIACAFLLLNAAAVLAGGLLFQFLPIFWIRTASALLFLVFGFFSFRSSAGDEADEDMREKKNPFVSSFALIFFAELGDKTQLVTASLAAQHPSRFAVFAGATLALWMVSLLGIFAGKQLLRVVPLAVVHRAAGVMFLGFGLFMLWQAFSLSPMRLQ